MSCSTGKREFASKRAAKGALKSIERPQGRMHAYLCEQGGHWHIGHSNAIGSGHMQGREEMRGYRRPRDIYSGFIVVGTHQIVFGNVCLTCANSPHRADQSKPSLIELDLPDDLMHDVWAAGDQSVIDTLLTASPDQLDAIKRLASPKPSRHQHPARRSLTTW